MSLERIKLSVWNGQIRERKEIYCNTLRFVSKPDRWEKIFSPNFTVYLFSDFSLIVPLQLCTLFAALVPPPGRRRAHLWRSSLPPPPPPSQAQRAAPFRRSATIRQISSSSFYEARLALKSHHPVLKQTHLLQRLWFTIINYLQNLNQYILPLVVFVQFINCFS